MAPVIAPMVTFTPVSLVSCLLSFLAILFLLGLSRKVFPPCGYKHPIQTRLEEYEAASTKTIQDKGDKITKLARIVLYFQWQLKLAHEAITDLQTKLRLAKEDTRREKESRSSTERRLQGLIGECNVGGLRSRAAPDAAVTFINEISELRRKNSSLQRANDALSRRKALLESQVRLPKRQHDRNTLQVMLNSSNEEKRNVLLENENLKAALRKAEERRECSTSAQQKRLEQENCELRTALEKSNAAIDMLNKKRVARTYKTSPQARHRMRKRSSRTASPASGPSTTAPPPPAAPSPDASAPEPFTTEAHTNQTPETDPEKSDVSTSAPVYTPDAGPEPAPASTATDEQSSVPLYSPFERATDSRDSTTTTKGESNTDSEDSLLDNSDSAHANGVATTSKPVGPIELDEPLKHDYKPTVTDVPGDDAPNSPNNAADGVTGTVQDGLSTDRSVPGSDTSKEGLEPGLNDKTIDIADNLLPQKSPVKQSEHAPENQEVENNGVAITTPNVQSEQSSSGMIGEATPRDAAAERTQPGVESDITSGDGQKAIEADLEKGVAAPPSNNIVIAEREPTPERSNMEAVDVPCQTGNENTDESMGESAAVETSNNESSFDVPMSTDPPNDPDEIVAGDPLNSAERPSPKMAEEAQGKEVLMFDPGHAPDAMDEDLSAADPDVPDVPMSDSDDSIGDTDVEMTGESNTGIQSAPPQQVEPKLFNGAVAPEQTDQETQDTPSGVSNTATPFQSTFPFRFEAPCSTQGNNPPTESIPQLFAPTPLRTNIASFLPTPDPSFQTDFADPSQDDEFAAEPETFMGEEERVDGEDEQHEGTEDNNEEQEDEKEDLAEDEDDSSDLSGYNDDDEDEDNSDNPGDGGASSASSPNNGTNDDSSFSDHDSDYNDQMDDSYSNADADGDSPQYSSPYGSSRPGAGPAGFGATVPQRPKLGATLRHTAQTTASSKTAAYVLQESPNYAPYRTIKPTVNTDSYIKPGGTPPWANHTGPLPPGLLPRNIVSKQRPIANTFKADQQSGSPASNAFTHKAVRQAERERELLAIAQQRWDRFLEVQALEKYYGNWIDTRRRLLRRDPDERVRHEVAEAARERAAAEARVLEEQMHASDQDRYNVVTGSLEDAEKKLNIQQLAMTIFAEATGLINERRMKTATKKAPQQVPDLASGRLPPPNATNILGAMASDGTPQAPAPSFESLALGRFMTSSAALSSRAPVQTRHDEVPMESGSAADAGQQAPEGRPELTALVNGLMKNLHGMAGLQTDNSRQGAP